MTSSGVSVLLGYFGEDFKVNGKNMYFDFFYFNILFFKLLTSSVRNE